MRILVTGSAGFIGYHVSRRFLEEGHEVVGFDALSDYYDVELKRRRHAMLEGFERFRPVIGRLEDADALNATLEGGRFSIVVHLAAQAGVRYSLEAPRAYVDANLVGTFNVLELARQAVPDHLLLASTSSVYGGNERMPFREDERADFPMTLYAATKKAGEAMSHSYSHLWGIPTTCFRFFTVYGPWGRPDMALFKFVRAITAGEAIDVYGQGRMRRDFTYVDDLVEALRRLADAAPVRGRPAEGAADSLSPVAPWRVVNVGGGDPVELMRFVETVEAAVGRPAVRNMIEMQKGDVVGTSADLSLLEALTGYRPRTPVEEGVARFVEWYRGYYGAANGV